MSIQFKKLAIATAVGASLGTVSMVHAADSSLLFPYFNTSSAGYTFISIYQDPDVNGAGNAFPSGNPPHAAVEMNLFYGFKPSDAAATDSCSHIDFPVTITEGALLQFEVSGKEDLARDFGDPDSYGAPFRLANRQIPSDQTGFLIAESTAMGSDVNGDAKLHGEAAVIDTATGMAVAYNAVEVTDNNNADFSGTGSTSFVTSWYPDAVVNTSWFALPVGTRQEMTPNAGGGITANIAPVTNAANDGAFGRGEEYTSGTKAQELRCWGTFGVNDLVASPDLMGGWMGITSTGTTAAGTDGMMLWKIQDTSATGQATRLVSPALER